jgi:hypothetical protein
MPSCEVQRTLVKSPPELWAELSDPASLAKHLGEFGEIRTVRVEPETAVEWEAEDVRGVVQLKASGWGTKVTLTAIRELAPPETPESLPEATVAQPAAVVEPEVEPVAELEAEPIAAAEPEPERRPGLFARIFRRRRKAQQATAEPEVLAPEASVPLTAEEPIAGETAEAAPLETPEPQSTASERPDLAAELAQVEQAMVEQDAALLTAVLDRLGAAHHRPFSRG